MLKLLSLILFAGIVNGCAVPHIHVTVPNITLFSVAGSLTDGAIWADSQDAQTGVITAVQLVQLLEASDGSNPANPKHAAAIILTATDYEAFTTAAESACHDLGKYCTPAIKQTLQNWQSAKAALDQHSNIEVQHE